MVGLVMTLNCEEDAHFQYMYIAYHIVASFNVCH